MGKKSRRDRPGNGITSIGPMPRSTPIGPMPRSTSIGPMPRSTPSSYNEEFRSIELTDCLRALDVVQIMLRMQKEGHFLKWQLGRRGTHISSYFITAGGLEDTITSSGPEDENFEMLTRAHLGLAVGILRLGDSASGDLAYWDLASGQVK